MTRGQMFALAVGAKNYFKDLSDKVYYDMDEKAIDTQNDLMCNFGKDAEEFYEMALSFAEDMSKKTHNKSMTTLYLMEDSPSISWGLLREKGSEG